MAGYSQQYTFGVNADTSKAQSALDKLQQSLRTLQSKQFDLQINDQHIIEASQAAQTLQHELTAAMNVKTGQLDLSKLNANLASAKTSVSELASKFVQAGSEGQAALSALSNTIASAEAPVKTLSKTFTTLGTTLMNTIKWQAASSLVHGMMSTFNGAITYAKNLNSTLNDIRIVTGASSDDMARFATQANIAAKSLSTTTGEFAKASLIYYQQGDSAAEAAQKAAITTKAANVAFTASAQEMSQMLTAVWNSYKMGGDELEHAVDVMAKLGATTATSMEEISTGMQKVAATANTVGVSMEQMSAMIATSSSVTRQSAESVGTAWNTILGRITSLKLGESLEDGVDLSKYTKALESIGVSALDATGNLREAGTLIDEIGGKWSSMNEAQKAAFAQTVGGMRQYTQIMAFFENFDKYQKNLDTAKNSKGALNEQQEIYAQSWEAASKRARAAMEGLYSALINDQAMTKLTDFFTTIINGFTSLTNTFGGASNAIGLLVNVIASSHIEQFATKISEIGTNIKQLFSGNQEINEYAQTLQQMQAQLAIARDTGSPDQSYQTQLDYDIQILAMKQKIAEQQDKMTQQQKEQAQLQIQQLQNDKEFYVQSIKNIEERQKATRKAADEAVEKAKERFAIDGTFEGSRNAYNESKMQDRLAAIQESTSQQGIIESSIAQKMGLMGVKTTDENATSIAQQLEEQFSEAISQAKTFSEQLGVIKNGTEDLTVDTLVQSLSTAATQAQILKEMLANGNTRFTTEDNKMWHTDGTQQGYDTAVNLAQKASESKDTAVSAAGAEALEKLQNVDASNITEINAALKLLQDELQKANSEAGQMSQSMEKFKEILSGTGKFSEEEINQIIEAARAAAKSTEDLSNNADENLQKFKESFQKNLKGASQTVQTFVQGALAIQRVITAFNAIKNAIDVIKNPETSGWEKFTTIMGTLVTVTFAASAAIRFLSSATVQSAAKSTVDAVAKGAETVATLGLAGALKAAGTAAKGFMASIGPVGWILLAITAAAAAITAIVTAIQNTETAEQKWTKSQEELNNSIDETKTKHEELGSSLATLSSVMRDTSLSYDEQLSKINEIVGAYGLQANAVDILSGKYGKLLNDVQEVAIAQATINNNEAQDEVNKANELINERLAMREITDGYGQIMADMNGNPLYQNMFDNINRDTATASLFEDSAWEPYRGNDGNTSGIWRDKKWTGSDLSEEGQLWYNAKFNEALAATGYQFIDGQLAQGENYTGRASDEALYQLLTNQGEQQFEALNHLTDGSFTSQLVQTLQANGYAGLDSAKELARQTGLVLDLFTQGKFDIARMNQDEASVKDVRDLIKATGATKSEDKDYLADYIKQFDAYSTAATQYQGIRQLASTAVNVDAVTKIEGLSDDEIQSAIEDSLIDSEYDVDVILKLNPTDIELKDPKNKKYKINEQAAQYAQAVINAETAASKLAKLQDSTINKAAQQSNISQADYKTLQDAELFESEEDLQAFVAKSAGERAAIWQQMIAETSDAQVTALETEVAAADERLSQLDKKTNNWLEGLANKAKSYGGEIADAVGATSGKDAYDELANARATLKLDIAGIEADIAEYEALTSEDDKKDWKTKWSTKHDEKEWDLSEQQANLQNRNALLTEYDTLLSEGDELMAAQVDTATQLAQANKDLDAAEYWRDVGSKIEVATTNAEKFTAAIGQHGNMSSDDLAWLDALADKSEDVLVNYNKMSDSEWNKYAYEQAKQYYSDLSELRSNSASEQIEIQQKLKTLDKTYYDTMIAEDEKAYNAIKDRWDKQHDAYQSAADALSGLADGSKLFKDLDFSEIETLRQKLMEVYKDAEMVDNIIKNIGKSDDENASTEDKWAATRAQVSLLLSDIALMETQADQYEGIYTVTAAPGDYMEAAGDVLQPKVKVVNEQGTITVDAEGGNNMDSSGEGLTTDKPEITQPDESVVVPAEGGDNFTDFTTPEPTVTQPGTKVKVNATTGDGFEPNSWTLTKPTITNPDGVTVTAVAGGDYITVGDGITIQKPTLSDNTPVDIGLKIADNSEVRINNGQIEIWGLTENNETGQIDAELLFSAKIDSDSSALYIDENTGALKFKSTDENGVTLDVTIDDENWPDFIKMLYGENANSEELPFEMFYEWVDKSKVVPGDQIPKDIQKIWYEYVDITPMSKEDRDKIFNDKKQEAKETMANADITVPSTMRTEEVAKAKAKLIDEKTIRSSFGEMIAGALEDDLAIPEAIMSSVEKYFSGDQLQGLSSGFVKLPIDQIISFDTTSSDAMTQAKVMNSALQSFFDEWINVDNLDLDFDDYMDTTISTIVANSIALLEDGETEAANYGKNLALGLLYGWQNTCDPSAFGNKGAAILAVIEASLAEASPSKATMEMGANLVRGLQIGFDNTEFDASGFGAQVLASISQELDGVSNEIVSQLSEMSGKASEVFGLSDTAKKANGGLRYMEQQLGMDKYYQAQYAKNGTIGARQEFRNEALASINSGLQINQNDAGKYVLQNINTGKILDGVYDTVGEAYRMAISGAFADKRTKEWLTNGINENLDSVRSKLVDDAKKTALANFNADNIDNGKYYDNWADLVANEEADTAMSYLQAALNDSQIKLQFDIDTDWAAIQTVWSNKLDSLISEEQSKADQTYQIWETTFKNIVAARKALMEGEVLASALSEDQISTLVASQLGIDGTLDVNKLRKSIFAKQGQEGYMSPEDVGIPMYNNGATSIDQKALMYNDNGTLSDQNTYSGWLNRRADQYRDFAQSQLDNGAVFTDQTKAIMDAAKDPNATIEGIQKVLAGQGYILSEADILAGIQEGTSLAAAGVINDMGEEGYILSPNAKAAWNSMVEKTAEELSADTETNRQTYDNTIGTQFASDIAYIQQLITDVQNKDAATQSDLSAAKTLLQTHQTAQNEGDFTKDLNQSQLRELQKYNDMYDLGLVFSEAADGTLTLEGGAEAAAQALFALAEAADQSTQNADKMTQAYADGWSQVQTVNEQTGAIESKWVKTTSTMLDQQSEARNFDGQRGFASREEAQAAAEQRGLTLGQDETIYNKTTESGSTISASSRDDIVLIDGQYYVINTVTATESTTEEANSEEEVMDQYDSAEGDAREAEEKQYWADKASSVEMTVAELQEYAQTLKNVGEIAEDLTGPALASVAAEMAREEKGAEQARASMSDWQKTLSSQTATLKEQQAAISNLRKMYGNLFNLPTTAMNRLSRQFLEDKHNADLLTKALKDDSKEAQAAWEELGKAIAQESIGQDMVDQINADITAKPVKVDIEGDTDPVFNSLEDVLDYVANMELEDLEVGATIDDAAFFDALADMEFSSYEAAAAVNAALASMGIDGLQIEEVDIGTTGDSADAKQHSEVHAKGVKLTSTGDGIQPEEVDMQASADASGEMTIGDSSPKFRVVVPQGGKKPTVNSNARKPGGGSRGCFLAGTLIATIKGYKNIEDIQKDDVVLSYNEKLQQNEYSQVVQTMKHYVIEPIYSLYIDNDKLEVTGIHRFYIKRNNNISWVHAKDLTVQDLILYADNTWHQINNITRTFMTVNVYNFEVSNNHNYYVGKNRILAHNKGGGGCFEAGTYIAAYEGYKNIEEVQIGDKVLSYNEQTKHSEYSEVLETMIHDVIEQIYTLYIENDQLVVTGIHRFYVLRNHIWQWIHASDLRMGDIVLFADGSRHKIWCITRQFKALKVYNFEVSNNHNYYVGKNQILAHNKGGGSRERNRSDKTHKTKDDLTRYHNTDRQLTKQSRALEQLNKLKNQKYGADYLDALKAENKELSKQLALQRQKAKEAAAYAAQDTQRLKDMRTKGEKFEYLDDKGKLQTGTFKVKAKLTYDSQGNPDYEAYEKALQDEYNAMIDQWNNLSAEEQEKKKAYYEALFEQYEQALDIVGKIEEAADRIDEALADTLETMNQMSSNNLAKMKYTIELKIDNEQFDKDFDSYLKKKSEGRSGLGGVAERAQLTMDQMRATRAQIQAYDGKMEDAKKKNDKYHELVDAQTAAAEKMKKAAKKYGEGSEEYKKAVAEWEAATKALEESKDDFLTDADYADWLKTQRDALVSYLNELLDQEEEMKSMYSDMWQYYDEDFERYTKLMSHKASLAEQFLRISELMGGTNYGFDQSMYQAQVETYTTLIGQNQEGLKQAQEDAARMLQDWGPVDQMEEWQRQQYYDALQRINDYQDAIYENTEQALTALRSLYESKINQICDGFEKSILAAAGFANDAAMTTLDDLSSEYEWYTEEQDRYLSTSKELYEVSKLNRKINTSLSDATTRQSKERLRALQETINKQSELNELTEYDVKQMNLQYELALAMDQLEAAKNNKDTVRLIRDENGNMGYQYTANQDKIAEAEQNYEDKLDEINTLAADRVRELEQQEISTMQEYLAKAKEISLAYADDEETRNAKLAELNQRYSGRLQWINEQYGIATGNLMTNQEAIYQHYGETAGDAMEGINSSIDALIGRTGERGFGGLSTTLTDFSAQLVQAMKEHKEAVDAVIGQAGLSGGGKTGWEGMSSAIGEATRQSQAAEEAARRLNETMDDQQRRVSRATREWERLRERIEETQAAAEEAARRLQEALELAQRRRRRRRRDDEGSDEGGSDEGSGEGGNEEGEGGNEEPAKDTVTLTVKGGKGIYKKTDGKKKVGKTKAGQVEIDKINSSGKWLHIANSGWVKTKYFPDEQGGGGSSNLSDAAKALMAKIDVALTRYESGGLADITGPAWLDGTKQKPEYILNPEDTARMFDAVETASKMEATFKMLDTDIVSGIFDTLKLTAQAMLSMFGQIEPGTVDGAYSEMQQSVEIHADFPAATDRDEISAAFEDLINKASQYANRKR